jgi:hypothetical protein
MVTERALRPDGSETVTLVEPDGRDLDRIHVEPDRILPGVLSTPLKDGLE